MALAVGLFVRMGELAPPAVRVLMTPEPAARALVALRREIFAGGREARKGEPGTVDVIAAPASVPRAVRLLTAVQELDGSTDRTARRRDIQARQRIERAAGDVVAARIDHCVVVRERNEREHFVVAITIEGGPPAVRVLHRELPGDGSLERALTALLRPGVGEAQRRERGQDFGRVVRVGVELVLILEEPAAGLRPRNPPLPVSGRANLPVEQPLASPQQPRILGRETRVRQGDDGERRIPDWREAGL